MKDRQPIDEMFRKKLSDFSLPVTDAMWQNIEQGIKKNRFRILLPWIISGTSAIIVSAAVYWLVFREVGQDNVPLISGTNSAVTQYPDTKETDINSTEITEIKSDIDIVKDNSYIANGGNATEGSSALVDKGQSLPDKTTDVTESPRATGNSSRGKTENSGKNSAAITSTGTSYENTISGIVDGIPEEEGTTTLLLGDEFKRTAAQHLPVTIMAMEDREMALPKLRKIRDRNCDNAAFSAGRTFLELSYGLHKGNISFRSTGPEFDGYMKLREDGEAWKNGTHIQALIGFQVSRNMYFKTGISYNRVESDYYFVDQVNKRKITDSIWNGSEWEVTEREVDIVISGTNSYTFVDIPLLLSYGWQFNRFGVALTTGPMINLSFSREGQLPSLIGQGIDLAEGKWNDREIYRKTAGLNWFTSVQLSYQTYKNVELFLEPRFIAGLNSLTLENDGTEPDVSKISYPIGQRMIHYGLGVGLRYSFAK